MVEDTCLKHILFFCKAEINHKLKLQNYAVGGFTCNGEKTVKVPMGAPSNPITLVEESSERFLVLL